MKLTAPDTVHVNELYRVKASGHTNRRLQLTVAIQTEAKGPCRKDPGNDYRHGAYPAIAPQVPPYVPVGPGDYSKRSDKLRDTKANGHDYVCGYLVGQHGVVLRKQKKIKSVR